MKKRKRREKGTGKEEDKKMEGIVRGITFLYTEIRNGKLQRKFCAEEFTNSSFPSQL